MYFRTSLQVTVLSKHEDKTYGANVLQYAISLTTNIDNDNNIDQTSGGESQLAAAVICSQGLGRDQHGTSSQQNLSLPFYQVKSMSGISPSRAVRAVRVAHFSSFVYLQSKKGKGSKKSRPLRPSLLLYHTPRTRETISVCC